MPSVSDIILCQGSDYVISDKQRLHKSVLCLHPFAIPGTLICQKTLIEELKTFDQAASRREYRAAASSLLTNDE